MRAFIAIDLPLEIKETLAELQALLKESDADVKWVKPHNIHLTLKFLGEIEEEKSVKITAAIENITRVLRQFQISLSSLGAFPNLEFPRVIWLAIDNGDKEIKAIAQDLEEETGKLGISKEERPFSSHITIGRIKSPLRKDKLIEALKKYKDYLAEKNIEFRLTKITLFKSTLGSDGPSYEALKEVNIRTS